MERRLLTFILMSTAFFFFYVSLRQRFGPPPPPVAIPAAKPDEVNRATPLLDDDAASPTKTASDDKTPEPKLTQDEIADKRPTEAERFTLGSMEASSGQYMLITLNSQGGGVERVELTKSAIKKAG